jgi:hypothetical protein
MDADRSQPPIEPTVEPDTSTAAQPEGDRLDAEETPALDDQEHEGVDELDA